MDNERRKNGPHMYMYVYTYEGNYVLSKEYGRYDIFKVYYINIVLST